MDGNFGDEFDGAGREFDVDEWGVCTGRVCGVWVGVGSGQGIGGQRGTLSSLGRDTGDAARDIVCGRGDSALHALSAY